jgi:glycerophosphoryl diester phosphodiesterase
MRKSGLIILGSLLVAVVSSCNKHDDYSNIRILGHGGNGLDNVNTLFHDNSLESIELALLTDGCDGIEIDVQLSLDNTLWLYHDQTLDSESTGEGCVATRSDAYLSTLNYQSVNSEKLIRLADVPTSYLANKKVVIDARSINQCTNSPIELGNFVNGVDAFRASCPISTHIIVGTNNVQWINAFSVAGFETMVEISTMDQFNSLVSTAPNLDYVIARNAKISKEDVSLIQDAGRKVMIFEVRSPKSTRSAFLKEPDFILTDNIRTAVIEKY